MNSLEKQNTAFNEAINYTIDLSEKESDDNAILFLTMWREGNWSSIEKEFPDFDLSTVLDNHHNK